ncbi:MAG: hypothetical protein AMS25_01375 [Gemmatimonas sp. SM23_52]|nr:MAG: hypothetical protein AMS25_01375 [Gemmatimonas sp. SM23_52]
MHDLLPATLGEHPGQPGTHVREQRDDALTYPLREDVMLGLKGAPRTDLVTRAPDFRRRVQERLEALPGITVLAVDIRQTCPIGVEVVPRQCLPQVLLGGEVVVDARLTDPEPIRQVLIAEGGEAAGLEQVRGGLEDLGFAINHGPPSERRDRSNLPTSR